MVGHWTSRVLGSRDGKEDKEEENVGQGRGGRRGRGEGKDRQKKEKHNEVLGMKSKNLVPSTRLLHTSSESLSSSHWTLCS